MMFALSALQYCVYELCRRYAHTASVLFSLSAHYAHSVSAIRFAILAAAAAAASQLISVLFNLFVFPYKFDRLNEPDADFPVSLAV
jgi:hypothetical protein